MPELYPDTALQVKENSALLVPDEGTTGHVLTVTGQSPFQYDFKQAPRDEILEGHGDPNGVVYAALGTPYVDLDGAPDFYLNSDGNTTWIEKAATGATGPSGVLGILYPGGNALLSADTFTTTWGTTNGGSLDPLTWSTNNGTWIVASGQAGTSAVSLAPARAFVDLTTGDADVSLTVPTRGSGSGMIFRYSDTSNYWRWECTSSECKLVKVGGGGGGGTTVGATHASADGDVLRVVAFGAYIAVLRNGTPQETVIDGHNMTATKFGMLTADTTSRFDNFSARAL